MPDLLVPRRFCGPPSSGNGGWTAGSLAALVDQVPPEHGGWPTVRVSLRKPPPLDVPLPVVTGEGTAEAVLDGELVASAQVVEDEPPVVEPVRADEARAAEAAYPGLTFHPFPSCFSCGVAREEGDGLRIFPGPVADQDGATRVAATWTPHPNLAEVGPTRPGVGGVAADPDDVPRAGLATTWAALDCIGGWAGDLEERMMVLAAITARVDCLPVVGEEHVLVGMCRGRDGRKVRTASTMYDADGRVVARAQHLWVAVNPAQFS